MGSKKRVNNLIIVSDLHVGCQLGLCPPKGARLDEGGRYIPNKGQKKLWKYWKIFWEEWVPEVCKNEPFAVCLNGDAVDGVHHGSTHQWSHNLEDQHRAALEILQPVVEVCEGRYFHIRGTEAHAGISGVDEEKLAYTLGAISDASGRHARYELWWKADRGLAHIMHHIGTSGALHYESTAVMKELSEAYVEAGRWNKEPPTWLVRSHRHRCVEVRILTNAGFCTASVTAGWQLKTPFAYKVAGGRQTLPQIGGTLLRCGDEDLYTRHKIWTIDRPKEEACYVD